MVAWHRVSRATKMTIRLEPVSLPASVKETDALRLERTMLNRRSFMRTGTFVGSLLGLSSVGRAATRPAANGPIRDAAPVTRRHALNVLDFLSGAEIDQIERNGTARDLS